MWSHLPGPLTAGDIGGVNGASVARLAVQDLEWGGAFKGGADEPVWGAGLPIPMPGCWKRGALVSRPAWIGGSKGALADPNL